MTGGLPIEPGPGWARKDIPGRVDLWDVITRLRAAFCRDTSELPDRWYGHASLTWTVNPNPRSIGQCHVSALILQQLFGGQVMEGHARVHPSIATHFWNVIDGVTIDITRDQFPFGVDFCHVHTDTGVPNATTREKSALLAQLAGLTA